MSSHKRFLSAFFAAAILVNSVGVTSFAQDEITEQVDYSRYLKDDPILVMEDGSEYDPDLIPEGVELNYGTAASSYFNLAEEGRVTSVKDQDPWGTCWAHAALASAESNMITKGYANTSIDYSEAHLAWFGVGPGPSNTSDPMYGDSRGEDDATAATVYDGGGTWFDSVGALARWSGAELESVVPYSVAQNSKVPAESTRYDSYATLMNANVYDPSEISAIKNCLVNNGAMQISYYHDPYDKYYNSSTAAYYCPESGSNHAVTLVGWDDNYSVSNFKSSCRPSKNGAWIIKNSWSPYWGKNGYFYISYEDASLNNFVSYDMVKSGTYSNLYQYDGSLGMTDLGDGRISLNGLMSGYDMTTANVFTATATEQLSAVGFYTYNADVEYKVTVYTGVTGDPTTGKAVYTTSGTMARTGYHTVNVSNVTVTKGQKFAVAVTLYGKAYHYFDKYNGKSGISYYLSSTNPTSSSKWSDCYSDLGRSPCIKAYTKAASVPVPQNLKATAGDSKVTLNWSAVSGATKYAAYYYLNGKYTSAGQTTGTSLTVSGLTNGTKYGFLVIACVNNVWSSYTTDDLVYATPVAKPKFTATAGDGQVTLKWSAVPNASKYAAYYYLNGKYTSAGQTTGTSLTVKNLTNGTKYGFLVIAYVNGAWTSYTTADLVYATPVAKPRFTATAGDGQVTLKWSAVTGATKYAAYYYLNGKYTSAGQTTGTSLTVKNLTNGTKYGFLVIAYVNGAWTPYTAADLVYATPVASSKPKFTATAGDGQVTLKWSAVTGATKYATYYYLNGKYTSAGQTTATSLTVKNLTNGTKYGFLVIAYVNGAWTSYTAADLVYATPVGSSKPVFTATPGDGQVTLKWSAVTGATKYATYYYLNGKYTSAGQTTGTSLTVKNLTNGTKYGFLVIAYVNGAWTSYTTADLVYATPVAKPRFTATAGNGQVTLNWSAVTGATKYATYYYLNGKYTAAGQTTGTTLTVKNLTNGTKYGFLVIAYVNGAWTSYTTADLVYATPTA